MNTASPDIDAVSRLIRETSQALVMPRFRRLRGDDIQRKDPGDPDNLVTIVDREVEVRLSEGLRALMPSAAVVGEEATHADPALVSVFESDRPIWVIDPIDGTRHFARGDEKFGIMVAFVAAGETRAAWVFRPAVERFYVAERGSGTFLNGERVSVPDLPDGQQVKGTLLSRYMPPAMHTRLTAAPPDPFHPIPSFGCSAVEYTTVLAGDLDFVVYYRLLPWDHAAPALVVTEGGGVVEHLDGQAYSPRSANQLTVVARDPAVSRQVATWLTAAMA